MSIEQLVADRDQGQIPVSISTSLALEGAFGIYPEKEVSPAPIYKYSHLWINVKTLFRNLMSVLPKEVQDSITDDVLADALASEILTIEGYVQNQTSDKIKIVFYTVDDDDVYRKLPKANAKEPTTPKQIAYKALEQHTLKQVPAMIGDTVIRNEPMKMRGEGNALIITHLPVDLLSYYQFDNLTLLESHTGKIKTRGEWGSKLGIKNDHMPLNVFTLQLFGDGSNMFSPYPIKHRRPIMELMEKGRWSGTTTVSKIRMGINTIKDLEIRKVLLDLCSE